MSRRGAAWICALLALCLAGCGATDRRPLRLGLVADSAGAGPMLDHHQQAAGALGARWLREEIKWSEVEPRPGRLRWGRFDATVAAAARRGLRVLPVLNQAPDWARAADGGLPTDPAPFARFTRAVVERYGPAGDFWRTRPALRRLAPQWFELWNEPYFVAPDRGAQDARRYARLAAAATATAHAADPAARVLLALRTSNATPPAEATDWLGTLTRTEPGLLGAVDGVTAHPYTQPARDALRALEGLLDLMAARGIHLPVWVTEVGWSTCRGDRPCVSEGEQARDLTAFADGVLRHPSVAAVFVYHLSSWPNPTGSPREGSFGLLRVDGSRKPAWSAYRSLAERTTG